MNEHVKLTILGCGGSLGIPNIMGRWGKCDPANSKNWRTRTSAWVEYEGKQFLIDTSPDLRQQIIKADLLGVRPDAVLYTHAHADHCHGMDELRAYFNASNQTVMPVYGHAQALSELRHRFDYIFAGSGSLEQVFYKPIALAHNINEGLQQIENTTIHVIEQEHGDRICLGYRFGPIAYSTDMKRILGQGMELLRDTKIWFVGVADSPEPHPTHAYLPEIIELVEELKIEQTYLIHLNYGHDYEALKAKCPPGMQPAYDGLVVEY